MNVIEFPGCFQRTNNGILSRRLVAGAAVLLVLVAAGCSGKQSPRHLVLVTFDTTRADRFGFSGHPAARTATADRLADEGVVCSNAIAAAPITLPSHATIMTGLLPPAHGVRDNGAYTLSPDATTLAEVLAEREFETRAFVSAVVLSRRYGLDQGFDEYDDDLHSENDPKLFMIRDRSADRTVDRALEWYRSRSADGRNERFFVWLHFFDPHQPYNPPADLRSVMLSAYDAEIAAADRALGRFLDELDRSGDLDDSLVVLTSDHGESLGEHGEKTHGIFVYDATVKVPLVFRAPKALPAGRETDHPIHHADLMPTVLGILGVETGTAMQGSDLSAVFGGRSAPDARPQYIESLLAEIGFGMAPLQGVRHRSYKWIRAPRPELYNLADDPGETRNLADIEHAVAGELDHILAEALRSSASFEVGVVETGLTDETADMLAALGYLAPADQRSAMSGIDPKDGMPIYTRLEEARHLAQEERWADAETEARAIVDEMPDHISARNVLALCLMRQNRVADAEREYERSLESDPHQPRVWSMMALTALLQGNFDVAEQRAEMALELAPGFVEAMANRGMVDMLRGDVEAAQRWYERATDLDPYHPRVQRRLGDLYYETGRWEDALAAYVNVLDRRPDDYRALVQAGNAARRENLWTEAEAYLLRAADSRPGSWVPHYNLACLAALRDDPVQAVASLDAAVERGFGDVEMLERDPDFDAIRQRQDFSAVLDSIRSGG